MTHKKIEFGKPELNSIREDIITLRNHYVLMDAHPFDLTKLSLDLYRIEHLEYIEENKIYVNRYFLESLYMNLNIVYDVVMKQYLYDYAKTIYKNRNYVRERLHKYF